MTELAKLEAILKHAEQISNDIDQLNPMIDGSIDYYTEIDKLLGRQARVIVSIKRAVRIAKIRNL